jgi:prepilin-type N-terminal cleavage/methylation domain-containing protein
MKVNMSRKSGFTLVEIMIVVAIIGLLAAIAVPNFIKARENSQKNACIANLKQIDGAAQTWALETKVATGQPIVAAGLFGANNYIRIAPKCPSNDSAYQLFKVGDDPQVKCGNAAAVTHVL